MSDTPHVCATAIDLAGQEYEPFCDECAAKQATYADEAIDGYLDGVLGIGSRCDAGHSLYVVNCADCAILQMHLSGEIDEAFR